MNSLPSRIAGHAVAASASTASSDRQQRRAQHQPITGR